MTNDDEPGFTFYGGPKDGEPVQIKPGWPPPDRMLHPKWRGGSYVLNELRARYEWETEEP